MKADSSLSMALTWRCEEGAGECGEGVGWRVRCDEVRGEENGWCQGRGGVVAAYLCVKSQQQ
jgi:hypothetical protein